MGGAIFVKDVEYLVMGSLAGNEPFFRLRNHSDVIFTMLGNAAELAGCAIYAMEVGLIPLVAKDQTLQ